MKKQFKSLLLGLCIVGGLYSCEDISPLDIEDQAVKDLYENRDKEKWEAEDKEREQNIKDSIEMAEQNKIYYEKYIADLKDYKKSEHLIMFGWFNAWSAVIPGDYNNLTLIPDSMDIISIWGNCFNIEEARLKQMREVQSKGTKVTVGWIIENVGNGLTNAPKGGWSNDPETGVIQYATAIADSLKKYGYDGFDIDYEPSYASPFKPGNHCGDWPEGWIEGQTEGWEKNRPIIACEANGNKQLENLFFRTLREKIGPEKILNINGSLHWLSPDVKGLFDYFVAQSYFSNFEIWTGRVTERLGNDVKNKIVYTESFQNDAENRETFVDYVNYVLIDLNKEAGGLGAFHINEDVFDNDNYRHIKSAINQLNPPIR